MSRRLFFLGAAALVPAALLADVDYLRDIKPILTQHCVSCHGASDAKSGLRADTAAALREGGDSGIPPLRVRKGEESFLLQLLTGSHADIPSMPYKKPSLKNAEIDLLRTWVGAGAPAPENEVPGRYEHWAFVAPQRVPEPGIRGTGWPRNPIDHFVLARLERDGIDPAPEATRGVLLRRVSLDLVGLPPSPAEVDAFLRDERPDAYDRVVDRLLASPHYGERWARPWLDVARYADSNGYSIDAPRQIWKYRDWVVAALIRDLPYDQFVVDQLAGDLLPYATLEQKVATGFNRNTQINQEGGINREQFRIEAVVDRVNTFGTAFLGLTVSCAQCHDHKFDPVTQREYYQLFAFFNNTVDDGHGLGVAPSGVLRFPDEVEIKPEFVRQIADARAELREFMRTRETAITTGVQALSPEARAKLKQEVRDALDQPWEGLSLEQQRLVHSAVLPKESSFLSLNQKLIQLERSEPKPPTTLVMSELPSPRETYVLRNGDFNLRGDAVSPGTPAFLPPLQVGRPTRLDLARWVVDPVNPLAARVFMNRVWQQYFGSGIVETENDFGLQGSPPSHPELLDWLATEFIARQWSMKAMHRLIVTSATYRQRSNVRSDLELVDPTNKLLARQSRLRLDAEIIRDVALGASGMLVPQLGGPPVYPPQPDGVMTLGQSNRSWVTSSGPNRYRRGLYTHIWRSTPHPAFAVFDGTEGFSACTRRPRSNTPLQALTLLNDSQFVEMAEALARRVQREAPTELASQIDLAFRLCLARSPRDSELRTLIELHETELAQGEGSAPERRTAAWISLARVLLNLDETITRE